MRGEYSTSVSEDIHAEWEIREVYVACGWLNSSASRAVTCMDWDGVTAVPALLSSRARRSLELVELSRQAPNPECSDGP